MMMIGLARFSAKHALISFLLFGFAVLGRVFANSVTPTGESYLLSILQGIDTLILLIMIQFAAVVVVCLYWAVGIVGISAWNAVSKSTSISDSPLLSKLLALAGTALLFKSAFVGLFEFLKNAAITAFASVQLQFFQFFGDAVDCISQYDPQILGNSCDRVIVSGASRLIQNGALGLFNTNLFDTNIIYIMLFAALSYLTICLAATKFIRDLNSHQQFWFGYALVAFFALYLALSAILVVPLLGESSNSKPPNPADLQSRLNEIVPPALRPPSEQPEAKKVDTSFGTLSELVPTRTELENVGLKSDINWLALRLAETDQLTIQLAFLEEGLKDVMSVRIQNNLAAAVDAYSNELISRKGQREALEHFSSLQSWFRLVVDDAMEVYSDCAQAYQSSADQHRSLSQRLTRLKEEILGSGEKNRELPLASLTSESIRDSIFTFDNLVRDTLRNCEDGRERRYYTMPERRPYGSFLGVIGFSVAWLLGVESMPVTLIVGLIGFGLLGALLAQFVQQSLNNTDDESVELKTIATVVFTGFSAAIIVYVGSYGGLAIASVSADDPNPYVVFGACLIGAIYSNVIWKRAKSVFIAEE